MGKRSLEGQSLMQTTRTCLGRRYPQRILLIARHPQIRLGMCGAPLLRVERSSGEECDKEGEVYGFLLWKKRSRRV
jgi:hypothetical protein